MIVQRGSAATTYIFSYHQVSTLERKGLGLQIFLLQTPRNCTAIIARPWLCFERLRMSVDAHII
jgi:hypothetical protein